VPADLLADLADALLGIALFALPGLALAGAVPALAKLPLPRRLAYGYPLGVAAVAGALYALSFFAAIPLRRPAVFAVAAAVALPAFAIAALRRRRPAPRGYGERRRPRRREPFALAVLAVGAAVSLGVLADAVSQPLRDWDGRMTWAAQARYVRAEGTVLPAVLLRHRWFVSHPRYPLLLPVAQAAVQEAAGAGPDEQPFRGLYAAFFPALLGIAYDAASRVAGRRPAALAALAAAGVPFFSFGDEGSAVSAYSDLPLAVFVGAALALLLGRRAGLAEGLAAGLLLAAAVLTKNEGALLALAALAAATAAGLGWTARRNRHRLAPLLAAAAVALAAVGFLAAWREPIPNRHDEAYGEWVRPGAFWPEVVTRAPTIASVAAARMASWGRWTLFWGVVPIVLAAGWRGLARRAAVPWLLAALAAPAVGWGAYTVHHDPVYLAGVTWDRMLLQAAVPGFVALAMALGEVVRRGRWRQPAAGPVGR
jgi:hypothetical protein